MNTTTLSYVEVLPWDAPRLEWLKVRQSGVGSSDIAGVLGQSSWSSPYACWWDKVGPLQDDEPSEQMKWGVRLEPIICAAWSEETGIATERVGLCRSSERPWQMATPDRVTADGGLLETKNVNAYDLDEWDSDTVPLKYLLQTTHQMDVLGVDHGYIAALIGGADLRMFTLTPDPEIVAVIRERGAAFWELVLSATPPPTDSHDATSTAVKRRWATPDDPESFAVLSPDWIDRLTEREAHKLDEKHARASIVAIDNALKNEMGAATHAVCRSLVVAKWRPRKDGVRVLGVVPPEKRREIVQ